MVPLNASHCTIGRGELPMTMQVGMVGAGGLVIAGDTKQFVERSGRSWYSYSSSKIRVGAKGRMAIACARNMDISWKVAERIFEELPSCRVDERAIRIESIGLETAKGFDSECIVAFADPAPSLYAFLCARTGEGRCMEVDKIPTGDAGNPAYFWAERYYTKYLTVIQLTRLAAHIIVSAGRMNNGSIQGLEVLTLDASGFRQWSQEENAALELASMESDKSFGEMVLDPMKKDKPIPAPTPKAFHDLLDKAATTQVVSVPLRKGKPASRSSRRAKRTSGA